MAKWTIQVRKERDLWPFSNTYHVEAADINDAKSAGQALLVFERSISDVGVKFNDVKVSPWPNPGNQNFAVVASGLMGLRSMGQPVGAPVALLVKIGAATGHEGKKWYRFALGEEEVIPSGKGWTFGAATGYATAFAAAADTLVDNLNTAASQLLIGSLAGSSRLSNNTLRIDGVGTRDVDVQWYNKNEGTSGGEF